MTVVIDKPLSTYQEIRTDVKKIHPRTFQLSHSERSVLKTLILGLGKVID